MHPNEKLIRDFYEAFERRDMETIQQLVHPDVVYHEGGSHSLSGEYRGLEDVIGFFEKVGQLFEGNVEVDIHDVVAGDSHVVVLENMRLTKGGKSLETKAAAVAHVEDGRVTEMWELRDNQPGVDELIGS